MGKRTTKKVLIADNEVLSSKKRGEYLQQSGFDVQVVSSGYLAQQKLLTWRPDFLIIDLMFEGFYAQHALHFMRSKGLLGHKKSVPQDLNLEKLKTTRVIVTSHHNSSDNVKKCIEAGASDFLVKPFTPLELLNRLMLIARSMEPPKLLSVPSSDPKIGQYFKMIELMTKNLSLVKPVEEIQWDLVKMVSVTVNSVRTSLISFENYPENLTVLASSDDKKIARFKLNIEKYPELQYVFQNEKPLFVESLKEDRTLSFIHKKVESIQFDSMVVYPIFLGRTPVAALSIRMPKNCTQISPWDVKMAELGAQLISCTWKFKAVKKHDLAS